jgi:hypothetical protein
MDSYINDLLIDTEKRLMRALPFYNSTIKEEALASLRARFAIKNSFFDTNDKKLLRDSAECALKLSIQDVLVARYKTRGISYSINLLLMTLALTPRSFKYT